MRRRWSALLMFLGLAGFALLGFSPAFQTPAAERAIGPLHALGEVVKVDPVIRQIVLKADGVEIAAFIDDKTVLLRVPPGEKNLAKGEQITLADISVGDRLLARGKVSEDRTSVAARQVIVMSKAAIAQKRERERREWEERGIAGAITALDSATREVTVLTRSRAGQKSMVVEVREGVELRRYAPDSVRFADARPSSFAELKVGDQLRALGEKSSDGSRYYPEIMVSGSFVMAGGLVTTVDPRAGEITINDVQTQKPLTVLVSRDSMLRRLPRELVTRLAQRQAELQRGAARESLENGADIAQTIEKLPAIGLADLEPGDMIMVSSTQGAEASRVTAIILAAGVEPLFRRASGSTTQNPALSVGFGDFMDFSIGLPPG